MAVLRQKNTQPLNSQWIVYFGDRHCCFPFPLSPLNASFSFIYSSHPIQTLESFNRTILCYCLLVPVNCVLNSNKQQKCIFYYWSFLPVVKSKQKYISFSQSHRLYITFCTGKKLMHTLHLELLTGNSVQHLDRPTYEVILCPSFH